MQKCLKALFANGLRGVWCCGRQKMKCGLRVDCMWIEIGKGCRNAPFFVDQWWKAPKNSDIAPPMPETACNQLATENTRKGTKDSQMDAKTLQKTK